MLVPNQIITVKVNQRNIKYYKDLGYQIPTKIGRHGKEVYDIGSCLYVKIEDLSIGSKEPVDVICDICGKLIHPSYLNYVKHHTTEYDYCEQCSYIKIKETMLSRYGVENAQQSEEIKQKTIETNNKRYGGNSPMCSKSVRNKVKKNNLVKYGVENIANLTAVKDKRTLTCMEKYGVENPFQSEIVKAKISNAIFEKYGVNHISQVREVKEKKKQTYLDKFGYESPLQSPEIMAKVINTNQLKYGCSYLFNNEDIQEKIRNTMLDKYGVDTPMKSDIIKDKIKNTNMMRYGVPTASSSPKVRAKIKKTCIEKYGYKYVTQVPEIREKIIQSLLKNGNVPTSSQQIELHKMIQEQYPDAILNYPYDRCIFDIALIITDNIKIDIEYDGWYWHQDKTKDIKRDYYVKSKGWKVLRIKSANKLPEPDELFQKIEYLINTEHSHADIFLSDWKEVSA